MQPCGTAYPVTVGLLSHLINFLSALSTLTNTSELFANETYPSTYGNQYFTLFSCHEKNQELAALGNGLVDYQVISFNGLHETEKREPSPELTVGHGRPSPTYHKRSGPDFENEDRLNYSLMQYNPEVSKSPGINGLSIVMLLFRGTQRRFSPKCFKTLF